ncbi:unnamed protein product [Didymodactylos carnosus]|uniref:Uncharacterized protein n=1 Tax=Didymodactylos carnosus TaxID=1234261 RepID=A0A8S2FXS8_9BILA|nr:unnamed protein product [Didymodactylos carnosus]CAF4386242.1 unnamed protein product [Didymodactylos carnosus]
MKSVLITGTNRGIGFGLVKRLALNTEPKLEIIFATYRDQQNSQELLDLGKKHKNVVPIKLDTLDDESIKAAYHTVEQKLNGQGLNMLINNAGVEKYLQLDNILEKEMLDTNNSNVIGPWKVTKVGHSNINKFQIE